MNKKIDLKIYGVVTVGPKGQIIIPKEMRQDFNVCECFEYDIVLIDSTAFGIGTEKSIEEECELENKVIEPIGKIKIGSKFQFVIPSIIRTKLDINPKDTLLVIGKADKGMGFIKNDKIEYVLNYIKENSQNEIETIN